MSDQPTTGHSTLFFPPELVKHLTHEKIRERIEEEVREQIEQSESNKWILRNPGAALTMLGGVLIFGQWVITQWMHQIQAPDRERSEQQVESIGRDIRTLAAFQLEDSRYTIEAIKDLARAQGVNIDSPPRELEAAEEKVGELRDR